MNVDPRVVEAIDWVGVHQIAKDDGLTFFDFLVAVDLGKKRVGVISHVMTPDASIRAFNRVELAVDEPLASLAEVFAGALWHEREARDLLGLEFTGHPDLRPILTTELPPPLRRDSVLESRIGTPWPGLYEPGAADGETRRRRPKPVPGVNTEWLSPAPPVPFGEA